MSRNERCHVITDPTRIDLRPAGNIPHPERAYRSSLDAAEALGDAKRENPGKGYSTRECELPPAWVREIVGWDGAVRKVPPSGKS